MILLPHPFISFYVHSWSVILMDGFIKSSVNYGHFWWFIFLFLSSIQLGTMCDERSIAEIQGNGISHHWWPDSHRLPAAVPLKRTWTWPFVLVVGEQLIPQLRLLYCGGQSCFLLSGEWWEFKDSLFELGVGKFCACKELSSFRIPFHGGMLVSKHFHMSDGAPPWANVSELLLFMVPWWKGNFGTGCSLHCYHFWSFSGRSAPHENWAALDIYPFP